MSDEVPQSPEPTTAPVPAAPVQTMAVLKSLPTQAKLVLITIGLAIIGYSSYTSYHIFGINQPKKIDQKVEHQPQRQETVERPNDTLEAPKDGILYVWSPPAVGYQSLVCLGVIDGNTIDAAYLVPVRIRIKGVDAPSMSEKGGKEAQEKLEKLVGGQLRTVQLLGPDQKTGLVLGDFWLPPEKDGDKGHWVSDLLK